MPANTFGLRLEQAYGAAVGRLWRQVAAAVVDGFDGIDRDDLAAGFRAFLPLATRAVALGQQQAQALAVGFVTQYVESQASRAFRPEPAAAALAGRAPAGDDLSRAMASAVGVTWLSLRQGRPPGEALGLGRLYAGRLAGRAVAVAADRELEHQAERSRGLMVGWEWVTTGGETCVACLAEQDGRTRPWSEGIGRHNGCECIQSPVLAGVGDAAPRPTGDELFRAMSPERQAEVFKGAGEDKAELVRAGDASLRDFIARERTPGGRIVTEAPLPAATP